MHKFDDALRDGCGTSCAIVKKENPMSDDPVDVIQAAIRSAFVSYPKEDDPDWRSPSWIMPKECAQLTNVIMRELEANGFKIVKKPT